jgi:DNA processing protein
LRKLNLFSQLDKETLKYQIALTLIPGVGDVLSKTIVSYCGSAEAVFKQKKSQLLKIPDIGPVLAESIVKFNNFKRAEEEIKFIEKYKIQPLFYLDKNYPERLKQCYDSPAMLYYKGNTELNQSKVLAIVGTRKATEYGKSITEEIITGLSQENILIISGLAYGIDIYAHKLELLDMD